MMIRVSSLSGLEADQLGTVRDYFRGLHPELLTVDYQVDERGRVSRTASLGVEAWDCETLTGESACRSCAVQRDLMWYFGQDAASAWAADVLVVLPAGVSGVAILDATEAVRGIGDGLVEYAIGSLMSVVGVDGLAEQLRSSETLTEKGFCIGYGDETCGRMIVEDLQLSDCCVLVGDGAGAGVELARQIAPQSRFTMLPTASVSTLPRPSLRYGFDASELAWRTAPGSVVLPAEDGQRVRTHLVTTRRPLHPVRLHRALSDLTAGSSWVRGRIWMTSALDRKIAFTGLGSRLDYSDAGPWLADRDAVPETALDAEAILNWDSGHGDRGTWLAFTGAEIKPDHIDERLRGCELTDDEIRRGDRLRTTRPG